MSEREKRKGDIHVCLCVFDESGGVCVTKEGDSCFRIFYVYKYCVFFCLFVVLSYNA